MKRPFFLFAAGLLSCAFLTSCGSAARFTYPDKRSALVEISPMPAYPQRVAVLPFEDFRSDENQTISMSLYYVPLSPFGYTELERPETGSRFESITSFAFNPTEDLAKAATLSLKQSKLFSDVFFSYGGFNGNADLVLEGRIESTYYKGRLFSYGLSIYSCYAWVLGAPQGTSLNRIALRLTLKDKCGRVLWQKSVEKEDYIVQWIYARRGQDAKLYSAMMREAMNEAIDDMASKLRCNPAALNPQPTPPFPASAPSR